MQWCFRAASGQRCSRRDSAVSLPHARQVQHSSPRVLAALKAAETPDIIEALLDKDTREVQEDTKKGASEAGRLCSAALELRGVQFLIAEVSFQTDGRRFFSSVRAPSSQSRSV